MRKMSLIIIFLQFPILCFGQSNADQILADILSFKSEKTRIKTTLDSAFVEQRLARLINSQDLKFKSKTLYSNGLYDSIVLTQDEKSYFIESLRKQYGHIWKQSDFHNFQIIEPEDIKRFVAKDYRHGIIMLSKPIFIRANQIAIIYLSYSIRGNGHNELVFYKLLDGIWKKSIPISAEYY